MNRSVLFKWSLIVTLLLTDIFSTAALIYSVLKSQVLITGSDPFILNVAMIFAIITVGLWVSTFIAILEVKFASKLDQRLVIIEKILIERGFSIRK